MIDLHIHTNYSGGQSNLKRGITDCTKKESFYNSNNG